jgi:hypothetical protein
MHESACTNSRIACSGMRFEPTWFIIDVHRLFMCFSLLFVVSVGVLCSVLELLCPAEGRRTGPTHGLAIDGDAINPLQHSGYYIYHPL